MEPLRKAEDLLTASEIKAIFSEIEIIKNFNSIMLADLQSKQSEIGEIFLRMVIN